MDEIEVKFLNISPAQIEEKLLSIGAKKIFEKLFRRKVFDFPDLRLDKKGAWVRLRDEGDKITLSYKQRLLPQSQDGAINDAGMKEIEITVNDFDQTAEMLKETGLKTKFYQENKRLQYRLEDIEFDLDFWPQIPPYLEIEAPSWQKIDHAITLLELDSRDKKIFSTTQIYKLYGIEDKDYQIMTFTEMIKK